MTEEMATPPLSQRVESLCAGFAAALFIMFTFFLPITLILAYCVSTVLRWVIK